MISIYAVDPPCRAEMVLARMLEVIWSGMGPVTIMKAGFEAVPTVQPRTVAIPDAWWTRGHANSTSTAIGDIASMSPVQVTPANSGEDLVPSMLAATKRLTGWSWDRLAAALGVTRQAVHGWTLGKEIIAANVERLAKLHAALTYIDRGTVEENRALLNSEVGDGKIAADLVDEGKFELLRARFGRGRVGRDVTRWSRLADEEWLAAKEEHWFDRLAQTGDSDAKLEIIPPLHSKRRVSVRRQG